jgi:formate hydrogenlyase subunit 6/NADH:ubiquinone oxidoreductase subunit I
MYCGLCVEACPYNALYMGSAYEQAQYNRRLLWSNKEVLTDPQNEISAYGHPEIEENIPRQSLLVYGELSKETVAREND